MKHIVKAVVILTIFSVFDRVLGFAFKIYLSRELGAVNLGIYQVALSVYFVLLTFTTSGTPLIISKMTAVFISKKDTKSQYSLLSAGIVVGVVLAVIVCGIILIFQVPISNLFATVESMVLLLILLPAVVLSGVYASFRGHLWGHQRHMCLAVIEIIEQIARILLCVILIFWGFNSLKVTAISMVFASLVTTICCVTVFAKSKGKITSPKGFIKPLIRGSMPITLIRASNTVVMSLVSLAIPYLLITGGASVTESLTIFGYSIGMALPLLFLPMTVVGSLAYVMIPTLSKAYANKDSQNVSSQISGAITFAIVIASMFIPMYFCLGESIGIFVYDNADSGIFLSFSAWLLLPISLESIVSSMMNSLDLEKESFVNYIVGSVVMFAILFGSSENFTINVFSIALGASLVISLILDIIAIQKATKISLSFLTTLIKCLALLVPTCFVTTNLFNILDALPLFFSISIASATSIVFFVVACVLFGCIDKKFLPKFITLTHSKEKRKNKNRQKHVHNTKTVAKKTN